MKLGKTQGINYRIIWEIDATDDDAATPVEAALWAWRMMRGEGSTACVFTVMDESGESVSIDLMDTHPDTYLD